MLCIPKTIDNLLYEWWALATGKMQKKFWQALSFGVAWRIWLIHNQVVFNAKTMEWDAVFGVIFHCLSCWIKVSKAADFLYIKINLIAILKVFIVKESSQSNSLN